jgi:hypothetical protein
MARTTTKQYNAVSTAETVANEGLSVRAARDHAWNANNYKFHAGVHKVVTEIWRPPIATLDDTTLDMIQYLGKWWIPYGFTTVRYWINARLTAGSDQTDFHLYSAGDLYIGPETSFDSTLLTDPVYDTTSFDTLVWSRQNGTLQLGRSDFNGYRYFYLVAQNDINGGDATTRAEVVTLDVQPVKT